jgi:hypothetical protein
VQWQQQIPFKKDRKKSKNNDSVGFVDPISHGMMRREIWGTPVCGWEGWGETRAKARVPCFDGGEAAAGAAGVAGSNCGDDVGELRVDERYRWD